MSTWTNSITTALESFTKAMDQAKIVRTEANLAYQEWMRLNWKADVLEATASSAFHQIVNDVVSKIGE